MSSYKSQNRCVNYVNVPLQFFEYEINACGSPYHYKMAEGMDPKTNKDQFSNGFKDVQESFYDLCSKLEKTQTGVHFVWLSYSVKCQTLRAIGHWDWSFTLSRSLQL